MSQKDEPFSYGLADALAAYAGDFTLDRLPQADREHLVDATVNWIGCAIGGAASATSDAYAKSAAIWSPHSEHRAIGRSERFGVREAVALDCLSSAVLAFDDTHLETVLHPTGPVAAALIGQARLERMTGHAFLTALHVGMETECRVALAITTPEAGAKRGWYATGVTGGIGAAVALGKIWGFDREHLLSAMGLAAAYASGNRGTHGSMTAAFVPAIAAESGFAAAHLTRSGLRCGARALDGSAGLLELLTDRPATERALRDLGRVSEAARTAFKPFPAGIVAHPAIEACLALTQHDGFSTEQLASLELTISPTAALLVANMHPRDVIEAQVSLYHWGAVALLCGAAGVDQAAPEYLDHPIVRSLQDRMSVVVDADLADDQCRLLARMHDGRHARIVIEHAIGSIARPMTSADIDAKFRALTRGKLAEDEAAALHKRCRAVLALDDVTTLIAP